MRRQTWFDGFKDAENLCINKAYTLQKLKDMLAFERRLVSDDYRWDNWCSGFDDYIINLEFRTGEGKF